MSLDIYLMKRNAMLNVVITLNSTALNKCKYFLFATGIRQKMYLFVCTGVSNKWNLAVYTFVMKVFITLTF
jgi:hypothetical protein